MSPQELAEWEAYSYFEPFGSPAADERARALNQIMWYGQGFKNDIPDLMLFDRDPEETARINAKLESAISLEDKVNAFFNSKQIVDGDAIQATEEPPLA